MSIPVHSMWIRQAKKRKTMSYHIFIQKDGKKSEKYVMILQTFVMVITSHAAPDKGNSSQKFIWIAKTNCIATIHPFTFIFNPVLYHSLQ